MNLTRQPWFQFLLGAIVAIGAPFIFYGLVMIAVWMWMIESTRYGG